MGTFLKRLLATIVGILISVVIFIVAIVIIISALLGNIFTTPAVNLERGTLLEISMNELIVDAPVLSPLDNIEILSLKATPVISMLDLSLALEHAASDPNITAVSLRMDGDQTISLAAASELRVLLSEFREMSGKPIYAYAESYSQVEYYLASLANEVYLNPKGLIEWQGVAANSLYFGDLFAELDIKAEVFRPEACTYKSAVEPYISNEMSEQSREQNQRIVSTFWGGILDEVSRARDINKDRLMSIAREDILIEPSQALSSNMVDGLCYRDEYDLKVAEAGVVKSGGNSLRTVTMSRYAEHVSQSIEALNTSKGGGNSKIAVIYADGVIVDGDILSASRDEVVSGVVARQLRRARNDKDVKAVIVRVNSPGGSALAADVIWREMTLLHSEKPLIVSFGSYAASGGYYISAPADVILTSPYTLTGSIGVYGVMFAFEDAMRSKLKINSDGVVSSPSADFGRVAREVTPVERAAMMRSVDNVYSSFMSCVAEGRHMSAERVAALSGGRVWSGVEAVKNGLADGIGGIRQALLLASDRCGLAGSHFEIVEYVDEYGDWGSIFNDMFFGSSINLLYDVKRLVERESGVMMLTPERVVF